MNERPDDTETGDPNSGRRSIAQSRSRRPGAVPAAAAGHPKVAGAVLMIGVVVLLIVIAALPLL